VSNEELLAGETAALIVLGLASLLVLATNPFALVFVLPALHAWLWLPAVRNGRLPARLILILAGLLGPAVLVLSFAWRYGLGFDAPWYVLELVANGLVPFPILVAALAAGACGAQLAAVATGRYAPYPTRGERPARGPLREVVRIVVLTARARRRPVADLRRRLP